jgi:hypothetical protein
MVKMKKFILLDFDGVMIPSKPWKPVPLMEDGFYKFDDGAISYLNRIIDETGATIILTTSHKTSYPNSEWKKLFEVRGINCEVKRLDDELIHSKRIEEIRGWVKTNTDRFVILDDDKSLNDLESDIKSRLVLTDSGVGLNLEKTELAIKILNNDI